MRKTIFYLAVIFSVTAFFFVVDGSNANAAEVSPCKTSMTGNTIVTSDVIAITPGQIAKNLDKVPPHVNIQQNAVFHVPTVPCRLLFSDDISGIKSATLNGQNVSNDEVISEVGKYTLIVEDKANNITKINFTILYDWQ